MPLSPQTSPSQTPLTTASTPGTPPLIAGSQGQVIEKASGQSALAGVSLKPQHYKDVLGASPRAAQAADFFEVHAENYFGQGGAPHRYLTAIRAHHALSIHGVGLSLGGAGPLSQGHLARLRALIDRYEPMLVSEHLAWCSHDGVYFNDLLPVPLTEEALETVALHVDQTQAALGRQILIENPSNYLAFADSVIPEAEFLSALVQRTGCGLLLDINNVAVSAFNVGSDAQAYLQAVDHQAVGEIHLAGHAVDERGGQRLKIDDHGSAPSDEVWALYASYVAMAGGRPTLVEWDKDVPDHAVLVREAGKARAIMRAQASGQVDLMTRSHAATV